MTLGPGSGNGGVTLQQNQGAGALQTLNLPTITATQTVAVQPTVTQASPANPAGTASTTGVMMGLAGSFTPVVTGRVLIVLTGNCHNNTAGDGCTVSGRYGTGAAPTNGSALTGTVIGSKFTTSATANADVGFAVIAIVTGLALGAAIWLDLSLAAFTGGTATMTNPQISVIEI